LPGEHKKLYTFDGQGSWGIEKLTFSTESLDNPGEELMIEINPKTITGNWTKGFTLDFHTISSEYIGDDEFGHPQFDTERSDMGELLYRLKYKSDNSVLKAIVNTACSFIKSQDFPVGFIVPVPPSRMVRHNQPVLAVANGISENLRIPVCSDCVVKVKATPELKNVYDFNERLNILKDAYAVSESDLAGRKVLLIDDLYRSGATLNAITKALYEKGNVKEIYAVTLTKTRSVS
jgi:predicted amidophosphoribosyltransferase